MKAYLEKVPHAQLFYSGHIPRRLHYGTHPNTLDFTLVADLGWRFTKDANSKPTLAGNHGYHNRYKQMQAIFYAMGPAL